MQLASESISDIAKVAPGCDAVADLDVHDRPPPRGDAIEPVATLLNLRRLSIGRTQITDEGLKHLAKLNELRVLHLNHNVITNVGLEHLYGLQHLETLNVGGTASTINTTAILICLWLCNSRLVVALKFQLESTDLQQVAMP